MPRLTTIDLKTKIRWLNRQNPSSISYDRIKTELGKVFEGIRVVVGQTAGHELFFRCRVNPKRKPVSVNDMGPPTGEIVVGFQRCNPPGQPMFYLSSRRITALLECDVQIGNIVYLGQWIGNDQLPVNRIFDVSLEPDWASQFSPRDDLVHSYCDTIFTRRVHQSFSDEYKFTSAVREQLTKGFKFETERNIRDDGLIGLRYPSVADIEVGYNTVFHPAYCVDRINLAHIMELEIVHRDGDQIAVRVLDNALDFTDGKISWLGDRTKVPLDIPEMKGVLFRFDGAKWKLEIFPGEPSEDYIRKLIYRSY